jgi:hypothetical protein
LLNLNASAPLTINAAAAPPPAPGTPSLLSPANDSLPNQPITFDWTDVANAARYEIIIDDSSTFSSPVRQLTTTESRIIVTGLATVRHWWRVRAFNSAGVAGSFSSTRRFTPRAAPAEASLSALSVSPTSVVGGNTSQGTVTLTSAAPSSGAVVSLSSANTAVATVPASVTVAGGATSATFTINTTAVSASTSVNLTATYNSLNRSATLTVTSAASAGSLPAPTLSSPANDARFDEGQTITFDWSDVPGAAGYTLQIDDADTFSSLVRSQNTTQSRYSTSSLPARRLWWRVRANDASGSPGAWSSVRRLEVRD